MIHRESQRFPTRQYPYRARALEADVAADAEPEAALLPNTIYRFVLGLDETPAPMAAEEVGPTLRDPFAELMLKRGVFPLTARALLADLDTHNPAPAGLPNQKVFLAADGGQIPWTPATAEVNRFLRFAVVRSRGADAGLLLSTSTVLDSEQLFLQVIGWDPDNEVYHFYERRGGTWLWAGSSLHALSAPTRGRGPFDSHVNGALVMKELRFPWSHWHSDSAQIQSSILAPEDPLRNEPLFLERANARELESFVVRPGIRRWNAARLKRATRENGAQLVEVRAFMRQVLETTTVNLISSSRESRLLGDDDVLEVPSSFLVNTEALLDDIGLDPDIPPIRVPGRLYRESLQRFEFALTDGSEFRLPGDTHFAFLVPEAAAEDMDVLALLLQQGILSPRLAASLMMVDFANPIFSARRRALLDHVPATAALGAAGSDLEAQFVAAVEAAGLPAESAAAEFLANYRLPAGAWQGAFEGRIVAYFTALAARAATPEGVDDLVRLAESRRRQFRKRPLAEFRLTLPVTNIAEDAPLLRMLPDGTLEADSG